MKDIEMRDPIRRDLAEAITEGDIEMLRSAIGRGKKAGMAASELEVAEAALIKVMWLDDANLGLQNALRKKSAHALRHAVDNCARAGMHPRELVVPKAILDTYRAVRSRSILLIMKALAGARAAQLGQEEIAPVQ